MPASSCLGILAAACSLAWTLHAAPQPTALPRSQPEKQGVAPSALLGFIEALDQVDGLHSVMVVRHGHVVAEGWWKPYDAGTHHMLYSLSKSFTSTAMGFAVAEGQVRVTDPVLSFFPAETPTNPSGNLKAMRVQDLLTMSTGHQDEPPTSPDRMSAASFLAQPVPHKPGTHFKYNTAATFMASAIVQKRTGQTVLDYLQPRLFGPLGIEAPRWDTNHEGISLGGYGLFLKTEDIAKFGQLYLRKGHWNGRQLLPAAWVEAATSRQVSNGSNPSSDWDQGYGYQFWRCRNGAYRGDGAFGQYCIVLPEQDAVVAITSGLGDMQGVLNIVWDRLLPAFQKGKAKGDPRNREALSRKLSGLEVRRPAALPGVTAVKGALGRTYRFPEASGGLRALRLEESAEGWNLVRTFPGGEQTLPVGRDRWIQSRGALGLQPAGPLGRTDDGLLAASGAWTGTDTFSVRICSRESPHNLTLRLRFEGDTVVVNGESNVSFGNRVLPELRGSAD